MRKLFGFFSLLFPCWFPPKLDAHVHPAQGLLEEATSFFPHTERHYGRPTLLPDFYRHTKSQPPLHAPLFQCLKREKREEFCLYFLRWRLFHSRVTSQGTTRPSALLAVGRVWGEGACEVRLWGPLFSFVPSFLYVLLAWFPLYRSLYFSLTFSLSLSSEPVLI